MARPKPTPTPKPAPVMLPTAWAFVLVVDGRRVVISHDQADTIIEALVAWRRKYAEAHQA